MLKTQKYPLFPYPGSKWRLTPKLLPYFSKHTTFVSVFGGSGAEMLRKPPSAMEVFNDLNPSIHAVFTTVRDHPEALARMVANTPARHQRVYEQALATVKAPVKDAVANAWAFLMVAHQGMGTKHPVLQTATDFSYIRKPHPLMARWSDLPSIIEGAGERLNKVKVESESWETLIPRFDSPATLFFIDPPYLPETLNSSRMYAEDMDVADHQRMLEMLKEVKGCVILCGYQNKLYAQKLADWRTHSFEVRASLTAGSVRRERTETVWFNYGPQGHKKLKKGAQK